MNIIDPYATAPARVAVIGTGISGLSAAWLLHQSCDVTVYEADDRIGGHSNTVDAPGPAGPVAVDTGFIVYNPSNYPNLVALFAHLGVPTKPSDMSFGASIDDGALEYGSAALFAQKRNVLRPRFWRMLRDIVRFYREAPAFLRSCGADALTLGQYIDDRAYSHNFVHDHLLPMGAAIWSTPAADMRNYPAAAFLNFCKNHRLLELRGRPEWRTVTGGSREYVRRLTAPFVDRIRLGARVRDIRRDGRGVTVATSGDGYERYDHVVIAAHADQALAMLGDADGRERAVLGSFPYTTNVAVLHRDATLMPRRRGAWSSWNYMSGRGADGTAKVSVTYWMNRLQSLDPENPLFVTLNPYRQPDSDKTIKSFTYEHPAFDHRALQAQRQLGDIQGVRRTWFCGSYCGYGFHEDGLQAGLAVAERISGVPRPWLVPGESDRIHFLGSADARVAA
ncbi:MAG: FAD-dependent oxidoreductase [Rhodospirillales bacterium]|nr:FAD-dependent oxidoreductase [Rhodospirillales bacterium]